MPPSPSAYYPPPPPYPEEEEENTFDEEAASQFEIIEGGTRTGKNLLEDLTKGYTYTVKRTTASKTTWQCSVRSKKDYCHDGDLSLAVIKKFNAELKARATKHVFTSANMICKELIYEGTDLPSNRNINNLIRMTNRAREKGRPQEPKDLDFEIAPGFMPEQFLQRDIYLDDQRHLIFATPDQLLILTDARSWYVDGTFKVVKPPFVQLWSIHGFLGKDDDKQVPLVLVLMSRRQTADYKVVMEAVLEMLPRRAAVQEIISDFERALWAAAKLVLPGIVVVGCLFHWSQAVWRKVQDLGLRKEYLRKKEVHQLIKLVLGLPYLPLADVEDVFAHLAAQCDSRTSGFINYIRSSWVQSTLFPPSSWNHCHRKTLTNNDLEGWHRRFNYLCNDQKPSFYGQLIPTLHEECMKIQKQVRLVEDGCLQKNNRKEVRERQSALEHLWRERETGALTSYQLLLKLAETTISTDVEA